jgi:hypothetical protein
LWSRQREVDAAEETLRRAGEEVDDHEETPREEADEVDASEAVVSPPP